MKINGNKKSVCAICYHFLVEIESTPEAVVATRDNTITFNTNIPTIMSAAQINGSISSSTWTADELMHGKIGGSSPSPPASPTEKTNGNGNNGESHSAKKQHTQSHHHHHSRLSMRKLGHGKNKPPTDPMDWGMPGHLTEEEVAVFVS